MGKKIFIFSTAYLPPIQYFQLLTKCDEILIERHETYQKQTYRNRCQIYSANGPLSLIIPVVKPYGNRTKIKDVRIDNSVKWRKEHWRAIQSAYKNSAYFEFIADYFIDFYEKEWVFIWDYNLIILETLFKILELNIKINETSEFIKCYPSNISDYRFIINPKQPKLNKDFELNVKTYFQVFGHKMGFTPNLSIIDLISNCGMDSLGILA
jgi:hypothetical protein